MQTRANPNCYSTYTDIKRSFGTACRFAWIRGLHWHDLRHTFGTRLAEAGCSEATIASLMGHSDPQTTRLIHTPPIGLNRLRWKLCGSCVMVSATTLPQRKNGCRKRQP